MGVKERRERVKQATRAGILESARQIAQGDGWQAVTIRKVADAIEYSPSIVYEYFVGKEDILWALLEQGYAELVAAMQHASDSTADPAARLRAIGEAYWDFARRNPDLYQVMHGLAGATLQGEIKDRAVQATCAIAENALIAWADDTGTMLHDSFGATEILWSVLHGLVSLTIIDRIEGDEQRARQLLRHALDTLLLGWSTPDARS